jgi:hypothetical protein
MKPSESLSAECESCRVALEERAYEVRTAGGTAIRCLRCALLYPPMVLRSVIIALIVGTFLTAINQGSYFLQGDLPLSLAWKVPITFLVPFCVATAGAILNSRTTPNEAQAT